VKYVKNLLTGGSDVLNDCPPASFPIIKSF
jgi:hypothetical protein